MVYSAVDLLAALRVGAFVVAIQDLLVGLIGIISISVIWYERGTRLPLFGGRFYPVVLAPGQKPGFLDDPNKSQYVLMGLVLTVGCTFVFGFMLFWWGAYKKKTWALEAWKLLNFFGFACAVVLLSCLAFTTEYSIMAMLGSFPVAFRVFEIWIVMSYQETANMVFRWDVAQKKKRDEIEAANASPNPNPNDNQQNGEPTPTVEAPQQQSVCQCQRLSEPETSAPQQPRNRRPDNSTQEIQPASNFSITSPTPELTSPVFKS